MVGSRETALISRNVDDRGNTLSREERERLIQPYLPDGDELATSSSTHAGFRQSRRKPIRTFIKKTVYAFVFQVMQLLFGIFYWFRRTYRNAYNRLLDVAYHHHRTPELIKKDVRGFKKLPQHLSVILDLKGRRDEDAMERLVQNVCEVAAWTACVRIPVLSIYEKTGVLKSSLPQLHRHIVATVSNYYGAGNFAKPTISLRSPNSPAFSPPQPSTEPSQDSPSHLSILLLSEDDGRRTLVDLTKTLAEMSQKHKLHPDDISSDLIDAELSESVMGEPDLLILFGDSVVLDGYPPWQVRLTEIFHVPDNQEVGYQIFLRGLQKFAGAQMRLGS